MEKIIKDQVDNELESLRNYYEGRVKPLPAKIPFELPPENIFRKHLEAAYFAIVRSYGGQPIYDDESADLIARTSRWFYSPKKGLLLMGTFGNGKTTLLEAIHRVSYPYSTLGNAIDIYDYAKRSNGELINYWDSTFLAIDDMGAEPINGKLYGEEFNPLAKILLHRYVKRRTTIIATNLGFTEISNRYTPRVADRLFEMFEIIPVKTASYRRR